MKRHALNFRTGCAQCGGLHSHARGDDSDPRQIMADLVSDDRSPFQPDDLNGLMSLTPDALVALRDKFLGNPDDDEDDPEVAAMLANRSKTQRHVDGLALRANQFRASPSPYGNRAVVASDAEIEAMTAGQVVVMNARQKSKGE